MKNCLNLFIVVLLLLAGRATCGAAVYQWSVEIPGMVSPKTGCHPRAFLWIPEDCREVKAVVVGQQNMCEETLFEKPLFRAQMQEAGIALVWITPTLSQEWDVATGCNEALMKALAEFAEVSGYDELATVPVVPFGHSAMATYPWNFAAWNPDRTLAIVSYHGDAPRTNLTGYGRANLEWGRTRHIDGIPGLMIEGEYEWWEARVNPALAFRMMYPESCISFLCDTERGHFDVSDRTASYIALFLKKAVEQRTEGQGMKLKKLDPQDGWLAERWRTGTEKPQGEVRTARLKAQPRRARTAPCLSYKGDKHDAFWYFDEEMALLTEEIYRQEHDLLPQYVSVMQEGRLAPYRPEAHVNIAIPFKPEADGMTFHLHPAYTDSLRTSLNHRHGKAAPRIEKVCGPVEQLNDTTFRLAFYRIGTKDAQRLAMTFVVVGEGDKEYKGCVQEFNVTLPYPLTEGRRQGILFPSLPDVTDTTSPLLLTATTDSGLPVQYYIKEGPAAIVDGQLVFTGIPPRSKFPLKVTVTAWQYGMAGEVQTAEPVERSFYILNR